MKKKKWLLYIQLLAAGMFMAACSTDDGRDGAATDSPSGQRSWRVSINAGSADDGGTRAISIGGNTGQRLYTNWDEGDEVQAVSGGAVVGTLTASITGNNTAFAKLDGTLNGTYAVGDAVSLYNHRAALDYSQQKGTVADVSTNCAYLVGESTVKEVDDDGGFLQMTDATFTHMQAFLDVTVTDANDNPLDVNAFAVYTSSGKLVLTKTVDGTTTYDGSEGALMVTPACATSKIFLALRNESEASDTYTFIAQAGSLVYGGAITANLQFGHYYRGVIRLIVHDDDNPLASVSIHRDNYGEATGWMSDVTMEINRDFYGKGIAWDSDASGQIERPDYGVATNF